MMLTKYVFFIASFFLFLMVLVVVIFSKLNQSLSVSQQFFRTNSEASGVSTLFTPETALKEVLQGCFL